MTETSVIEQFRYPFLKQTWCKMLPIKGIVTARHSPDPTPGSLFVSYQSHVIAIFDFHFTLRGNRRF
jgi:hypothetical protein